MEFYVWTGNSEQKSKYKYCELCKKQPFTQYMVKNHLWTKQYKHLCLHCFQQVLGRALVIDDFLPCQFTNLIKLGYLLGKNQEVDLTDF